MRLRPSFLVMSLLALCGSPAAASAYLASDLLGQLDQNNEPVYTTSNAGVSDRMFSAPGGATLDPTHHRLFVTDSGNSRVLIFGLADTNNLLDRIADHVLGQPDFTSSNGTTTQSGLRSPLLSAYESSTDRLFVADTLNNRVLVFDVASITDGEPAVFVLGQPDFTSSNGTTTESGLNVPVGLALDPAARRLFVADAQNNRIMVFDVSSLTNGEPAVNVLGQPLFTTSDATTSQTGLKNPICASLHVGDSRLFVGDNQNHRVTVYDVSSLTSVDTQNRPMIDT